MKDIAFLSFMIYDDSRLTPMPPDTPFTKIFFALAIIPQVNYHLLSTVQYSTVHRTEL